MSKVKQFYNLAYEFQSRRDAVNKAYDERMHQIQPTKGSEFYTKESKAAADKRDSELRELRAEYAPKFNDLLDLMRTTNSKRGMNAPTPEELRTIELLKLRDNVTREELDAAANTVSGNPVCLAALSEIARRHGILKGYEHYSTSSEMPISKADNIINSLARGTADLLRFDTSRAARVASEHMRRRWGIEQTEPLAKRKRFESQGDFYAEVAGLSDGEMEAFSSAVS